MTRIAPNRPISRTITIIALAITWFAWGSSFIAIHWATAAVPPLAMMASRFVAAGAAVAMAALLRTGARQRVQMSWAALRDSGIVGIGMITVSMGLTGWACTRLESGIASLLMATVPVWMATFSAAAFGQRPHGLAVLGVVVGICGIGALMSPGSGGVDVAAAVALTLSNAAWAAASLFATRAKSSGDAMLDTGVRMLLGGIALCVVSAASGELSGFHESRVGLLAVGSWAYLVLLCSVVAFIAYEWLVRNTSSTLASTHAFVNPAVAVVLGALVLHEAITVRTLIAGAGIVSAVTLLVLGERRLAAAAAPAALEPVAAPPRSKRRGVARRPMAVGRARTGFGFDATPTPAFARRSERPWAATDGMDALAIDVALDRSM